jgi:hypothetical protein
MLEELVKKGVALAAGCRFSQEEWKNWNTAANRVKRAKKFWGN